MTMIAMAIHDLEGSGRTEYTRKTLTGLMYSVDWYKHRLFLIDNNSCFETKEWLRTVNDYMPAEIITLPENIGTAEAINLAWQHREPGENCIKMDNDVVIYQPGWIDEMEDALSRDRGMGIVGLKRKDLIEAPWHHDPFYKSELCMLPHKSDERWIVVEKVNHVIGTCQMFRSELLDEIGYLYQPSLYGFDDVLASRRSHLAGFYNCFLPHIHIDHIDTGGTEYTGWKERHAGEHMAQYERIVREYQEGTRSIYYNPFEK